MFGWIYLALLIATVFYVCIFGEKEQLSIAVAMLISSVSTYFLVVRYGIVADALSTLLFVNETVFLALVVLIAYRSNRFWPIPFASLEMAVIITMIVPMFGENLVARALGIAQGMWAYPQLLILVLATARNGVRRSAS